MELGNMMFGHSRGEYEVPREERWEEPMFQLLTAIDENAGVYGTHFSNDVFEVRPYFWGDCTCGKEQPNHSEACRISLEHGDWVTARFDYASGPADPNGFANVDVSLFEEFEASTPYPPCTCGAIDQFSALKRDRDAFIGTHSNGCYQTRLQAEFARLGGGICPFSSPERNAIYKQLTDEFGLPMGGCAAHCTCDHHSLIEQWEEAHPHAIDCVPTLPNFRHFSSGFEVRWYKYALRDSYMNQDITCERWWEVIAECCRSIKEAPR